MSSAPRDLRLKAVTATDGLAVALIGCERLDEATTQEIRVELLKLIEPADVSTVTLSLAGVEYMTSTLLAVLIMVHKRLKDRGGRLVVCDVAPDLLEIFEVTKVALIMEIRPDRPTDFDATV